MKGNLQGDVTCDCQLPLEAEEYRLVVREERFPLAVALTTCARLLPPNFDLLLVTSWHIEAL